MHLSVEAEPLGIEEAHALIAAHLEGPVANESYVQHVEYDPELRRWYVRFTCVGRDATTIYFDLHERTLRYEVYFLPIPPENLLELYEFMLRRNHTMYGARFSIGPDGDLYLVGRVALEHLRLPSSIASSACSTSWSSDTSSRSFASPTVLVSRPLQETTSSVRLPPAALTGAGVCWARGAGASSRSGKCGTTRAFLGPSRVLRNPAEEARFTLTG